MQIWPAIDIRGGKCVRLVQGDYARETVYGNSPADMAARWIAEGADRLHIVNLDGARDGGSSDESRRVNLAAIGEIARSVSVPLQVGGGIRDDETIEAYLDLGIQRFVIGTRALQDQAWTAKFIERHPAKILIGIDARDGMVAIEGWAEITDVPAIEFARQISQLPVAGIIYTDIQRDGMLEGPNVDAMAEMARVVDVPVIASGGVTTAEDVAQLARSGLAGCIVGRSLYEGRLALADALAAAHPGGAAQYRE